MFRHARCVSALDLVEGAATLSVGRNVMKIGIPERVGHWLERSPSGRSQDTQTATPEQTLTARIRAHESAAIDEAYRLHHQPLRNFAQRLLGDRSLAEDLLHDVFVTLPSTVQNFRGEGSFRAFLLGVTAYRSRSYLRAAGRRRAALTRFQDVQTEEPSSPEVDCERLKQRRELMCALDKLPHEQRTALVLCEVEERNVADVAHILGVPEGTVRSRCFHARKKLARSLRKVAP